jgi:5-formyltetrahydrofolate cyclo-ligase
MTLTTAAPNLKPALRVEAMARRDALSPAVRDAASASIAERCRLIIAEVGARTLAGYMPIRTEVDDRPLLEGAAADGIALALPAVLNRETMVFRKYRPGDALFGGGLGTRSPGIDAPVASPDLILVPMVAFDRRGTRLGHGAGYYDRAIGAMLRRRPPLVGLAFAVQEVKHIPHEPHDIRLDWIVTERETIDLRGKGG